MEQLSTQRSNEQRAALIRRHISIGALKPGDKLPTERIIGEDYRAKRIVVRGAVKTLKQKGPIEIRSGLGTYVFVAADRALSEGDADAAHNAMLANLQRARRDCEASPENES